LQEFFKFPATKVGHGYHESDGDVHGASLLTVYTIADIHTISM